MSRRLLVSILALVAGGALLVWQVRHTGLDLIVSGMAAVGWWGAGGILVLSLMRFQARSTGWTALLASDTEPGRALAAVIAGDAAGNLTPLSVIVGEPMKAAMLASPRGGATMAEAFAALAAETFFFGVSVALYVMLGAAAMLTAVPLTGALRVAGWASLGGMALALAGAAWMALRKPTVFGSAIARLPIPRAAALAEHVRAFERTAYGTTTHPGARIGVVIAATVVFHALSFAELWFTLWLITGDSHVIAAFLLDSVGRLANVLFKMIPLQLGVLQVGSELVGVAAGLAPGVGVAVSLVRTVRVLFWAAIGVGLMGRRGLER